MKLITNIQFMVKDKLDDESNISEFGTGYIFSLPNGFDVNSLTENDISSLTIKAYMVIHEKLNKITRERVKE